VVLFDFLAVPMPHYRWD